MKRTMSTVWIWRNYRDTSLMRNSAVLAPYSRNVPRALWWSQGGGHFRMSEVFLYTTALSDLWGKVGRVRAFLSAGPCSWDWCAPLKRVRGKGVPRS